MNFATMLSKRGLALLLALSMCAGMVCTTAFAVDDGPNESLDTHDSFVTTDADLSETEDNSSKDANLDKDANLEVISDGSEAVSDDNTKIDSEVASDGSEVVSDDNIKSDDNTEIDSGVVSDDDTKIDIVSSENDSNAGISLTSEDSDDNDDSDIESNVPLPTAAQLGVQLKIVDGTRIETIPMPDSIKFETTMNATGTSVTLVASKESIEDYFNSLDDGPYVCVSVSGYSFTANLQIDGSWKINATASKTLTVTIKHATGKITRVINGETSTVSYNPEAYNFENLFPLTIGNCVLDNVTCQGSKWRFYVPYVSDDTTEDPSYKALRNSLEEDTSNELRRAFLNEWNITATYELDADGDKIPDKYQVTIGYQAEEHGSLTECAVDGLRNLLSTSFETIPNMGRILIPATEGTHTLGGMVKAEEGYHFAGWTVLCGGTEVGTISACTKDGFPVDSGSYRITGGHTYTFVAIFEKDTAQYTVTVDPNNDEEKTTATVEEGKLFTVPEVPTAPEGKEFDVWKDNNGNSYSSSSQITITDDLTLTAQWKDKEEEDKEEEEKPPVSKTEYTVTFNSNGGSAVLPQTVEEGGTVTPPNDPERDGYTFAGWMLSGEMYDFSTPVGHEITLTAQWNPNNTNDDTGNNNPGSTGGGNGGGGSSRPTSTPSASDLETNDDPTEIEDEDVPLDEIPEENLPEEELPEENLTEIEDEDTPLTELPEELTDIEDEDVPLTGIPGAEPPLAEIEDENVPLSSVPQTGDNTGLWCALAMLSSFALAALSFGKKREDR